MRAKKAKEPVRIRFKELADGNKSIYLDIYKEGKRKYEFLKLYLIPEKTPFDKRQNKVTIEAANAIKAKRIIELTNGQAGITPTANESKLLLSDLMDLYSESRAANSTKHGHGISRSKQIAVVASHLRNFNQAVMLKDIDKDFCIGFSNYIQGVTVYGGKHIGKGTANGYFAIFISALNYAVKMGFISSNPASMLESDQKPQKHSAERGYLTREELIKLMETPKQERTKFPFLFSCFTGLRFVDVMGLTWANIVQSGNGLCVSYTAQKTGKKEIVPIPMENVSVILPERTGKENDFVFERWSDKGINQSVDKWAKEAGIKKHITFHTARHTYATLLLTQGADLYTVSKLLGHSEIKTTQIYAEIIDRKKEEAASLLNGLI